MDPNVDFDDVVPSELKLERAFWRRLSCWILGALGLVVLVVLICLLAARAAVAMPQLSQEGCMIIADAALVARGGAIAKIERDTVLVQMTQIYDVMLHAYLGEIIDAAYRAGEERSAKAFAQELLEVCYGSGGDLSKFLGEPA